MPIINNAGKTNKSKRVTTGMKELDNTIEGGFKKKSINIVQGGPGSGKTILGMQYLVNGIKEGENGVYLSFEETRESIIDNLKAFGWDLEELEKQNKLAVIAIHPTELHKEVQKESWYFWTKAAKEIKATRIVVDSVTSYSALFEEKREMRDALGEMFDFLREIGLTTLLISEKEKHVDEVEKYPDLIEFLADSVINLYNIRRGDTRQRALEIHKIRGTAHEARIMPVRISAEGFRIFPQEQVF